MATIRKFCCNDLLRFTSVNLDHLTSTTEMSFYLTCLASWSDLFLVALAPGNRLMGYLIGRIEEDSENTKGKPDLKLSMALEAVGINEEEFDKAGWSGLVLAVNVAYEYRRRGLAMRLMRLFEQALVDKMLFSPRNFEYYTHAYVLTDIMAAIRMFEKCGYVVIGITRNFYFSSQNEGLHSYEMKKMLSEEEGIKYSTYG